MPFVDKKLVLQTLLEAGLSVKGLHIGLGNQSYKIPYVHLGHTTYPGVEAHLFTIADSALWIPSFTSSGDVVIFRPAKLDEGIDRISLENSRSEAWQKLLAAVEEVVNLLTSHREYAIRGYNLGMVWAHHEVKWYRSLRDAPEHEQSPIDEILGYVDASIRPHIQELNELGFMTIESCSGLADDHPNREPYRPYVMFDDRVYINVSAHLFTVADIAQWMPSYGPHAFDVVLQQRDNENVVSAWSRLVAAARTLEPLVRQYRSIMKDTNRSFRRLRKQGEVPDGLVDELLENESGFITI